MTAETKIEMGIRRILKSDRELGRLLRGVEVVADPKCGGLEITPHKLGYDPAYVRRIKQGLVTWILKHEAMHLKLQHTERFAPVFKALRYDGLTELARIATDMEVNHMIRDKKHMPAGAWVAGKGDAKKFPPNSTAEQYLLMLIIGKVQHVVRMRDRKQLRTPAVK